MSLRAGLPDVEPKTKSGTSGKRTCRRSVRPSQVTCWNMRHVKTCCGFVVAPRHTGEIDVYCVCVVWIRTDRAGRHGQDVVRGSAIFSSSYSNSAVKLLYSVFVMLHTSQSCGMTV